MTAKQLTNWKYVSDAEKAHIHTLLQHLCMEIENPNPTTDELASATDELKKAVKACERTERDAADMMTKKKRNKNEKQQSSSCSPTQLLLAAQAPLCQREGTLLLLSFRSTQRCPPPPVFTVSRNKNKWVSVSSYV